VIFIPGYLDTDVYFMCNVCRKIYRYKSYGSHKEKCEKKVMEAIEEGEKVPGLRPEQKNADEVVAVELSAVVASYEKMGGDSYSADCNLSAEQRQAAASRDRK
jgi:hypothetical protein